jgi:hypothetical protein
MPLDFQTIYNFPALMEFMSTTADGDVQVVGMLDAPLSLWEAGVRAIRPTRYQVTPGGAPFLGACACSAQGRRPACLRGASPLPAAAAPPLPPTSPRPASAPTPLHPQAQLILEMNRLQQARIVAVREQRATISAQLQALAAAGLPFDKPPPPWPAGGGAPGAAAAPPGPMPLLAPLRELGSGGGAGCTQGAGGGFAAAPAVTAPNGATGSSGPRASAPEGAPPDAARRPSAGGSGMECQLGLLEGLEENLAAERWLLQLFAAGMLAVFTPRQIARVGGRRCRAGAQRQGPCCVMWAPPPHPIPLVCPAPLLTPCPTLTLPSPVPPSLGRRPQGMAALYPYPPHQLKLCEALDHALKFQPDMFAPDGAFN